MALLGLPSQTGGKSWMTRCEVPPSHTGNDASASVLDISTSPATVPQVRHGGTALAGLAEQSTRTLSPGVRLRMLENVFSFMFLDFLHINLLRLWSTGPGCLLSALQLSTKAGQQKPM